MRQLWEDLCTTVLAQALERGTAQDKMRRAMLLMVGAPYRHAADGGCPLSPFPRAAPA